MEAAAARSPYQLRRAKRPGTSAAQIDAPAVGTEAAAGPAARRPRRRRTTAQIGIPSHHHHHHRAKTLQPHHPLLLRPIPNLPHPRWGVRRARSSHRNLDDSKPIVQRRPPRPNRAHPWGGVRRARSSPRDLDYDSNKLQPLLPSADYYQGAKQAARSPRDLDDSKLPSPDSDYRGAKRPRSPRDLDDSKQPLLSPDYHRGAKRAAARSPVDYLDDSKLQQQPLLLSPDYRGAKRARPRRDLDDSNKLQQPLLSPDYRGVNDLPCPPDDNKWRDWSGLGDGPAGLIAERVLAYDVADYVRFRAVCRPWRQCSTEPRSYSGLDRRFHPWRWTMLRDKLAAPDSRCFLNTSSTGECVQVSIPELRDHHLLAVTSEGLLVLLNKTQRATVCLLNPLTRHLTELPPLTTLLLPKNHSKLLQDTIDFDVDLTAWGSGIANDDSTVVLCFNSLCMIGLAKPGDDSWNLLQYNGDGMTTAPLMFEGRFYCVNLTGVMVLEMDADHPPQLKVAAKLRKRVSPIVDSVHLINNCGQLMLVHRRSARQTARNKAGRGYDAYRVDLDTRKLWMVKSLGGNAVFMGLCCSLSVPLDVFPSGSICADTIYFSFDIRERTMLVAGAYHLADGSIEFPCSSVPRPHTLIDCLCLSTVER